MNEPKIRLTGLTKFDKAELGDRPGIEYQKAELEAGQHGVVDVFTATIAMALISTAAAYLLRKHNETSFDEVVELEHSDGRIERRVVRYRTGQSEAPEASIIKQIRGDLPGTPP